MHPSAVDVVILGAGPSGSTLAALLRRYRPSTSVLVLEREPFPRHRIGESLLVDVNRILADMGALAEVEAAGFSRKYGATFLWGDDREPYHFLWREGAAIVGDGRDRGLDYTWHVDRAEYDRILADRARALGAQVLEGYAAIDLVQETGPEGQVPSAPIDPGARVVGVRVRGPAGEASEVQARLVVDCAGAHGPLHRLLAGKRLDEALRNVAVYGYLRGVGEAPELDGGAERRTLILTHPQGWVWVIPLRDGITSVGFVTAAATWRAAAVDDPAAYYRSILGSLREHERLFAGAELVDYRGDGRLVHTVSEYSYQCERIVGPGWATCGNAAGFVDAILSIGVYVAQTHAQFLACALRSILDGDVDEAEALACYAATVRDNLGAFRAVAHMFYAFNTSMSGWWRECSAQLRQSTLVPARGDRQAFLAFFTGFSARSAIYEEAVNAFGGAFLHDVGAQLFDDAFLEGGASLADEGAEARALCRRDPILTLAADARARPFWLPDVRVGALAPVIRVDIAAAGDRPGPDVGRRLYLPAALAGALDRLDGRRRLSQIARELHEAPDGAALGSARAAQIEVMKLAYRLVCMGALIEAVPGDMSGGTAT